MPKKELMKYIWMLLAGLIFTIGVMGFLSPKNFLIEKSVIVNKGRLEVFNKVRLLKTHKEWNPWAKKDPSIVYNFKGVDGKEGFISHWLGNNKVGEGEQEIKKIVEGERIDYEIRFKSPFETTHYSSLTTTETGDSNTKLTWTMKGQMQFPFNIIFKIFKMQEKLEYDLGEGTNVLKEILEKEL